MFQKLEDVERRYIHLEASLVDPAVIGNRKEYARFSKERSDLDEIVQRYRDWKRLSAEIEGHKALLEEADPEIRDLAKAELPVLRERLEALEEELKRLLLPRDPNDERNIFLEIRAGTGGDESGLFAGDLFRMYSRYAERNRWQVEVWMRPWASVAGTRCTRCVPDSNLRRAYTPRPATRLTISR